MPDAAEITGVVLSGGRGLRMGGVDKGLQPYRGVPLAQHALRRLQSQVGACLLNANRHQDRYAAFGVPVVSDEMPDFAGPLAGFVTALRHCQTPWLVTVPCDSPLFPVDLVARLAASAFNSASISRTKVACSSISLRSPALTVLDTFFKSAFRSSRTLATRALSLALP